MKRFIPLIIFTALAVMLGIGLTLKPAEIPSALVGKPVPDFALPAVAGSGALGLSSGDIKGKVVLVNVFASWCGPCKIEHPQIMALRETYGLEIVGLSYKDKPADAIRYLAENGNPYGRIGADFEGRVAMDFGVTGAPETFVIDRHGLIRDQHIGPIMASDMKALADLVKKLEAEP